MRGFVREKTHEERRETGGRTPSNHDGVRKFIILIATPCRVWWLPSEKERGIVL